MRHWKYLQIQRVSMSLCAAIIGTAGSLGGANAQGVADAAFVNGVVFTADEHDSIKEAFAVKDGKFVATGTSREIRAWVGAKTTLVDLRGRFVMPGLSDAHYHGDGQRTGIDIDLISARSIADVLSLVEAAVKKSQPGQLLTSNNAWNQVQLAEKRMPLAKELDNVSPNNPVVIRRGNKAMVLNSAAFRKFNISPDTVVPEGGTLQKDSAGNFTGLVTDRAMRLVTLPPLPPASVADIERIQRVMNAYGVTALRVPGQFISDDLLHDYKLIKQTRDAGRLTIRYSIALPGRAIVDPDAEKVKRMIERWGVKQDEGDEWLRIWGVKFMADGGFEGAHMHEPYEEPLGKHGSYFGTSVIPTEKLIAIAKTVDEQGFRMTVHALGDAAVEQVLDAYQAVSPEGSFKKPGWAIEHAAFILSEDFERIRRMHIELTSQAQLYFSGSAAASSWGNTRAERFDDLNLYLNEGLHVTGGSDGPYFPFNPFVVMYHMVTRDTLEGVYGKEHGVSNRVQLLRMFTSNYARLIGEEQTKGSIERGKFADFAVLSENLLTLESTKLRDVKALSTYVGGVRVYQNTGTTQ